MTATVTDLFCGAGGSSTGAAAAGMQIVLAANHWTTAIDVHQVNHPNAAHDCADISQVDPRRYPRTDVLLASPECTNHSQARGLSRKRQDASLFDGPDPAAERSRATMWDVVRFAEQMRYDCCVVENVVEATKWVLWQPWLAAMLALGYEHKILSHNSMHHGVPQSRDRIYVVFWRKGLKPNLELELTAWCPRCAGAVTVRQAWKPGRSVGRYRQQWVWSCTTCSTVCEPATEAAATIIDWELACPRIGDRTKPLADATRARILAGLQRYGWAPITTSGAGNVHERTPGNRARSIFEPVAVQQTTATTAVATPPGFQVQVAHGKDSPSRTRRFDEPIFTAAASNNQGILVQPGHGAKKGEDPASRTRSTDEATWTVTAHDDRPALVVPLRRNGKARPPSEPLGTVTAGGDRGGGHHGLLMRNNGTNSGAEMVTPAEEPARTFTSKLSQSLLMPYYGNGQAQHVDRPVPTVPTKDRFGLVTADLLDPEALARIVDDCGFRMLEPYEIAAAMAFPLGYIPRDLSKKDQVKLAGNAVCPPNMTWIAGRLLQALEAA